MHIFPHHLQVHQFGLGCQVIAVSPGAKCTNQKALKQVQLQLQSRRIEMGAKILYLTCGWISQCFQYEIDI